MHRNRIHTLAGILAMLLAFAGSAAYAQSPRIVMDSAGRRVEVPPRIERVMAAGPPAVVLLYTLAPEKMLGWVRAPDASAKEFLSDSVRDLPEYGRLTAHGGAPQLESVRRLKPDLIIDVGNVGGRYLSIANDVQEQTKIPYLLLDGALARTPQTYRTLGRLLGVEDRAEQLARYAEATFGAVEARVGAIPQSERVKVYYAHGADGLETAPAGSIVVEVLAAAGALNVATAREGGGAFAKVSIEQVRAWDPDVILAADPALRAHIASDPQWSSTKAVRDRRIYVAPGLPFGWFETPPGVNRLIGVRWLASLIYPNLFPEDVRDLARDFYRRFYHVDVTERQLDALLKPAALQ